MQRKINTDIYDIVIHHGMKQPDILVAAQESFGQCAEDVIVMGMLVALAEREQFDLRGVKYMEVGANHPISCSATYLLQRKWGMSGILVEANPALIDDLRRFRPMDRIIHAAVVEAAAPGDEVEFYLSNQDEISSLDRRFVEEWRKGEVGVQQAVTVPARTINQILEAECRENPPIFLSIDIEGVDLEVLGSMDWRRWRPAVIQTEPSEQFKPGNTQALLRLLADQGYAVVARTDVNLIACDAGRFLAGVSGGVGKTVTAAVPGSMSSPGQTAGLEQANRIRELQTEVGRLQQAVRSIETSTSWRVTQPLRLLARRLRRRGW